MSGSDSNASGSAVTTVTTVTGAPISTVEALLAAARRAGLAVTAPEGADLDRSGLDFLVVHATDAAGVPWIVRTPRRPDVVVATRTEARVLQLVGPRLPVGVPDWRVHTDDVIAYPRLGGVPASTFGDGVVTWNVDQTEPSDVFIDSVARAYAALAAISLEDVRAAGVPEKPLDAMREAHARAIETTREALDPPAALVARWQAWLGSSTWPTQLGFVHGDLHPGHLLIDEAGELTGILDWTEGHAGDPSLDFAMFLGCFGRRALDRLLARFAHHGGTVFPHLAEHAAERWAFFPVLGAEWALRTHNEGIIEFARSQLGAPTP